MTLHLYNTLSRKKETFTPIDADHIRMYVCGPTVYDRPHLGNARSVVVYDVLYRLLKHLYPRVTYVRNITDVDDKINAAAKANNEPISALTSRIESYFHADMDALNVLRPTTEPHATQHITQMIAMIEKLIASDHAYVSQNHVLFSVTSYKDYGALSGRKLDELIAGARIEVESYKRHPGDFVLWKPAEDGDDASSVFQSPWGQGRPGWHIECSAMSCEYLGDHFDIHGGGADLMFPHHENEIAQSRCAMPGSQFANLWVHNGFLTVNGEKMSKSLGNFTTVKDLLDKGIKGEVLRYAFLSTHYRSPLDWTEKMLSDAKKTMDYFYTAIKNNGVVSRADMEAKRAYIENEYKKISWDDLTEAGLLEDLNVPFFLSVMHLNAGASQKMETSETSRMAHLNMLLRAGFLMGFFNQSPEEWFKGHDIHDSVQSLINARIAAKQSKNWPEADRIRKELAAQNIILEDKPDGTTDWRRA